jgi:hypothetical protein
MHVERSISMKMYSGLVRVALGACASVLLAAGCTGSQTPSNALVPSGMRAAATAPFQGAWIASGAQTRDLLYVSDDTDGGVYLYSYPAAKLQGRLPGARANGLCSSKNGNVFIPEGDEVLEYAHAGTRAIAVLRNPLGGDIEFCAVDPTTGDLAVSSGKSGVAIYVGAKGSAKVYRARQGRSYGSVAYDGSGNLFIANASHNLVELPKGAARFNDVAWSGMHTEHLGSIQWDGKYLAVQSAGSESTAMTVLRYSLTGSVATFGSETMLKGVQSPLQFLIRGTRLLVPDSSGVSFYAYPQGGAPLRVFKDAGEPRFATVSRAPAPEVAVTTYHYDNLRTGWNDRESSLTYANVNSSSFGLLSKVTLDDQVDSQPLVVPNVTTTRGATQGAHDVVYVATENDTIYAIDASSGTVLFQQSLGAPVPMPLGCNNNGPNVGITSTPVIDVSANVMYVVAYTLENYTPTYRIHELSLSDLTDVVPSVVVSASHTLTNGTLFAFNATYQRQRPALLEANGNVYAGFGSFCDYSASNSRGWLLGWQAGSLTPLSANRLNDSLTTSPDSFFLSSIWMSGYGPAADSSGNVYFVTGNSDYSGTTYNGVTNIQESVVKVSPDLTKLLSIFTPYDVADLDEGDVDFGSGGVLLLPLVKSSAVPLAAAAGKDGTMYLLDQNSLGGYVQGGPNNDLAEVQVGGCWCGQSYFAEKGSAHIVSSGGNAVTVWKVRDSRSIKLDLAATSPQLPGEQDPGFFTVVSSTRKGRNAIIWALARPAYVPGPMSLFAFTSQVQRGSSQLQTLYQGTAGYWAASNGDANLVPIVANGKVYVASYEQLDIFGLGGSASNASASRRGAMAYRGSINAPNEVTGTLVHISGSFLTLRTRSGKLVRIDDSEAVRHERTGDLVVGKPFNVRGKYDAVGVLHAAVIVRAKPSQASWLPDR